MPDLSKKDNHKAQNCCPATIAIISLIGLFY